VLAVRRALVVLLSAVLAAACSGADPGSDEEPVARLDVGIVPVIDVAPLYLGINKGFFAAHRLAVTPKLAASGSLIVPAVVAGEQQIGFSNNTSLLIGAAKGLPRGRGARVVLRPYPLIAPYFPVASYFTGRAYAASDPAVVRRFRDAMNQSLAYAQNHPDEVRKVLPSYIKLTPAVAAKVMLPEWNADLGAPLLQRTADLALKYGYLDTEPDVAQLIEG